MGGFFGGWFFREGHKDFLILCVCLLLFVYTSLNMKFFIALKYLRDDGEKRFTDSYIRTTKIQRIDK